MNFVWRYIWRSTGFVLTEKLLCFYLEFMMDVTKNFQNVNHVHGKYVSTYLKFNVCFIRPCLKILSNHCTYIPTYSKLVTQALSSTSEEIFNHQQSLAVLETTLWSNSQQNSLQQLLKKDDLSIYWKFQSIDFQNFNVFVLKVGQSNYFHLYSWFSRQYIP